MPTKRRKPSQPSATVAHAAAAEPTVAAAPTDFLCLFAASRSVPSTAVAEAPEFRPGRHRAAKIRAPRKPRPNGHRRPKR